MSYMVECNFTYGWDDADWHEDDKPLRFSTREEAEAEIESFIEDMNEAYEAGNVEEPYSREDYRVVESK